MALKRLVTACLAFISVICIAGCSFFDDVVHLKNNNEAILASDQNRMLLQALAEEYNASQSKYKVWLAEENAGKGQKQPDIYLLEFSKLVNLEQQNKLFKFEIPETAILPEAFKSQNGCWYGVFYDPAVLLVNQNFARRAGQENIRTWEDLLKIRGIRIALENLSDTESTRSFLYAFASHWGEDNALGYLRELHKNIPQYAKFPFTSIRMAATGDADIAITRSSFIFQYLENSFPAYVAKPVEGTPVNLYAVAIAAESGENMAAQDFCRWLLTEKEIKRILLQQNTGLETLMHDKTDTQKLWLNTAYLQQEKADKLINKWLETVRFEN